MCNTQPHPYEHRQIQKYTGDARRTRRGDTSAAGHSESERRQTVETARRNKIKRLQSRGSWAPQLTGLNGLT